MHSVKKNLYFKKEIGLKNKVVTFFRWDFSYFVLFKVIHGLLFVKILYQRYFVRNGEKVIKNSLFLQHGMPK